MNSVKIKKQIPVLIACFSLIVPTLLFAQVSRIDFESQQQLIRGYGGVNMPSWIQDLSLEEVEKAYGTGDGQIGLSILRIKVPTDANAWAQEVPATRRAKEMGAILLATPWSPPEYMKSSNSIVGGELLPEHYAAFTQHLADFQNYMTANGAPLYAISIQNEPDYRVDYESCDWNSQQMMAYLKEHAANIPARVVVSESFNFDRNLTDPILKDPEAAAQVDIIGGHIYGSGLYSYPLAKQKRKEVWMTEHLVLETDWPSVLATGKEIHDCMLSDFNAYIWWYIRRSYGPIDEQGNVSKRGFVMSHFSRFIRPGYYRVQTDASPAEGVSVSAYRDLNSAVIVAINQNSQPVEISLKISGGQVSQLARYETTADHNVLMLEPVAVTENLATVTLPGGSITTFTGAMESQPTFVNPVLPGDHPDLTLLKHGGDFYVGLSNFHRTPFGTILHSKDLMHWETLTNVVPSNWSGLLSDAPSDGTWQGAITYFYDSFWFYFSNNAGGGQYFCKAPSPEGPWSVPVKLIGTATTGASGYDNSVFVDDDGTPYLVIKAGRYTNRIQQIGPDGHLIGDAINLDWVNEDGRYGWAEGPVMCKRNGWYYYFVAGNVVGGQWVLRSQTLTADPSSWEELGAFFEPVTDPNTGFRGPNHIGAPVELADGTWWTISHSYESLGGDDWGGLGRQGLLHRVTWDEQGKPTGSAPVSIAMNGPRLLNAGIPLKTTRSDSFDDLVLAPYWYFLKTVDSTHYSLTVEPGWIHLNPAGTERTSIMQRVAEHAYTLITCVRLDTQENATTQPLGGLYLANGNESKVVRLYASASELGIYSFGNDTRIANTIGNQVWLKLERAGHLLNAYYSADGDTWNALVMGIDTTSLDCSQPDYNSWIGNSHGLFAEGGEVAFDHFLYNETGSAESVWLEAECGQIGSEWEYGSDAEASNSLYVAAKLGNNSTAGATAGREGWVTYNFEVTTPGLYHLWARMICPTANDDSLWVRMDSGEWFMWNGIAPNATSWTWDNLPQLFSLSVGSHTLSVGYREDGTWMDKLCITQSDVIPEESGNNATNCH